MSNTLTSVEGFLELVWPLPNLFNLLGLLLPQPLAKYLPDNSAALNAGMHLEPTVGG